MMRVAIAVVILVIVIATTPQIARADEIIRVYSNAAIIGIYGVNVSGTIANTHAVGGGNWSFRAQSYQSSNSSYTRIADGDILTEWPQYGCNSEYVCLSTIDSNTSYITATGATRLTSEYSIADVPSSVSVPPYVRNLTDATVGVVQLQTAMRRNSTAQPGDTFHILISDSTLNVICADVTFPSVSQAYTVTATILPSCGIYPWTKDILNRIHMLFVWTGASAATGITVTYAAVISSFRFDSYDAEATVKFDVYSTGGTALYAEWSCKRLRNATWTVGKYAYDGTRDLPSCIPGSTMEYLDLADTTANITLYVIVWSWCPGGCSAGGWSPLPGTFSLDYIAVIVQIPSTQDWGWLIMFALFGVAGILGALAIAEWRGGRK